MGSHILVGDDVVAESGDEAPGMKQSDSTLERIFGGFRAFSVSQSSTQTANMPENPKEQILQENMPIGAA